MHHGGGLLVTQSADQRVEVGHVGLERHRVVAELGEEVPADETMGTGDERSRGRHGSFEIVEPFRAAAQPPRSPRVTASRRRRRPVTALV